MNFKLIICYAIMLSWLPTFGFADSNWYESYEKAMAEAKKTGKPVLVNFTGSDWCSWCIKMESQIFSTDTFKDWSEENIILLMIDFPSKNTQSARLARQNQWLKNKYQVRGLPTLLFLDEKGNLLGQSGYYDVSVEEWVARADEFLDSINKNVEISPYKDLEKAKEAASKNGNLIFVIVRSKASDFEGDIYKLDELKLLAGKYVTFLELGGPALDEISIEGKSALKKMRKMYPDKAACALLEPTEKGVVEKWASIYDKKKALDKILKCLMLPEHEGRWLDNFEHARLIAAREDKPILADFTGSDWCGWCIKMDEEIFSKEKFLDYSKDKLVLVKVDFPNRKKIPATIQAINSETAHRYQVKGYPTVLLLTPQGEELGRFGYIAGGVKSFIKKLTNLID